MKTRRHITLGPGAFRLPPDHLIHRPGRQPVLILPPADPAPPDLDPDTNPAIAAFCDTIAEIITGTLLSGVSALDPDGVDSAPDQILRANEPSPLQPPR